VNSNGTGMPPPGPQDRQEGQENFRRVSQVMLRYKWLYEARKGLRNENGVDRGEKKERTSLDYSCAFYPPPDPLPPCPHHSPSARALSRQGAPPPRASLELIRKSRKSSQCSIDAPTSRQVSAFHSPTSHFVPLKIVLAWSMHMHTQCQLPLFLILRG